MTLRHRIRSLVGGAAVLTLLGLIAADTVYPTVTLALQDKLLLISLVSALLGIDIAVQQIPFVSQNGSGNGSEGTDDG